MLTGTIKLHIKLMCQQKVAKKSERKRGIESIIRFRFSNSAAYACVFFWCVMGEGWSCMQSKKQCLRHKNWLSQGQAGNICCNPARLLVLTLIARAVLTDTTNTSGGGGVWQKKRT